jgi:hypothetical protein
MAKKQDKDLLRALRAGGVRDRVAHVLAQATGSSSRRKQPKMVTRTIDNLKTASAELDRRVRGSESKRSGQESCSYAQAECRTTKRQRQVREIAGKVPQPLIGTATAASS